MTLVTVAMLMLSLGLSSISGLSRAVRDPAAVNTSMLRAMSRDALDPAVKNAFAAMQMEVSFIKYSEVVDFSCFYTKVSST